MRYDRYLEPCFECESWNTVLGSPELRQDGLWWFKVTCRDCGHAWEDYEDVQESEA